MVFNTGHLTELRLKKSLEATLVPLVSCGMKCLDVGCGNRPYEYLFPTGQYIGIDIETSGRPKAMKCPDFFYDGTVIPFGDGEFDLVISTQVLEHVPDPLLLLKEMARVCKSGGKLVISLPFVYQEHEEPYDFFRFTQFAVAELLEKSGFRIVESKRDSSAVDAIVTVANNYIITNLAPKIKGCWRIYAVLICFPLQVLALVLSKVLPDDGRFYLNRVVSAAKV